MSLPQFSDVISLSLIEIIEKLDKAQKEIFDLQFKKATRQNFKGHELKNKKRYVAQLETLLTIRINQF